MKKLLFLSAASSIHTVKWVNALSKYYEVHLVYCPNHAPDIHNISAKVILHELKYKAKLGYYTNVLQMKKLYKEIKPDIINVHYASGYATLARLAKLPKTILNVWGSDVYDFPNKSKLNRIILKRNIFYANKLASTSEVMANEVKRQFPDLKKDIAITPFGVDTKIFKKIDGKKTNKFIIGNIKALNYKYGIKYIILGVNEFIERLKKEKKDYNNVECQIYGDGEEKEKFLELVKSLGLEKTILFKGKIPNNEVPKVLSTFNVFVAASIVNESFGVAVVEAMSCEVPIIATKIAGFSEVMVDNETGIMIEKESFTEISNALWYMYNNEKKCVEFGKNGRKRVLDNYDWDKNVKTMKDVYEKE